jgi:hypothetical protein
MINQQQGKYKNILQGEDDLWRIIRDTADKNIEFQEVELGNVVPGPPPTNEQDQEEPSSSHGREDLSHGSRRSICGTHQSALCGALLVVLGAIVITITYPFWFW